MIGLIKLSDLSHPPGLSCLSLKVIVLSGLLNNMGGGIHGEELPRKA
jgi:hypothetical protein